MQSCYCPLCQSYLADVSMSFKITNSLFKNFLSNERLLKSAARVPKQSRNVLSGPDQDWDSDPDNPETELRRLIGNREVVGYGINGQPNYVDSRAFPFPAIRWMEYTQQFIALKEKEKGDWKELSMEDKKTLYRASFRQTFAEMSAPSGYWKSIVGITAFMIGMSVWAFVLICIFIHNPAPHCFKEDIRKNQLKRLLDLKVNPINGISSKWDYEAGEWKSFFSFNK